MNRDDFIYNSINTRMDTEENQIWYLLMISVVISIAFSYCDIFGCYLFLRKSKVTFLYLCNVYKFERLFLTSRPQIFEK